MAERNPVPHLVKKSLDFVLNPIAGPVARNLMKEEKMGLYRGLVDLQFPEIYHDKLQTYVNEGKKIMILSNHRSHGDGLWVSFITEDLTEEFGLAGFLTLGAASMRSGHQGKVIQKFAIATADLLADHSVFLVDMIRPADRILGMTGNNMDELKLLRKAPQEGLGIDLLPEGKVEGGRKKKFWGSMRKGMQSPDKETQGLIRLISRNNDMVILPVGIIGSEKVFSPDTRFLTMQAMYEFYRRRNPDHGRSPIVQVKVGEPFAISELKERGVDTDNAEELTEACMGSIAALLPLKDQGNYAFSYYTYAGSESRDGET